MSSDVDGCVCSLGQGTDGQEIDGEVWDVQHVGELCRLRETGCVVCCDADRAGAAGGVVVTTGGDDDRRGGGVKCCVLGEVDIGVDNVAAGASVDDELVGRHARDGGESLC